MSSVISVLNMKITGPSGAKCFNDLQRRILSFIFVLVIGISLVPQYLLILPLIIITIIDNFFIALFSN